MQFVELRLKHSIADEMNLTDNVILDMLAVIADQLAIPDGVKLDASGFDFDIVVRDRRARCQQDIVFFIETEFTLARKGSLRDMAREIMDHMETFFPGYEVAVWLKLTDAEFSASLPQFSSRS